MVALGAQTNTTITAIILPRVVAFIFLLLLN
jgi:hypothetical protein